MDVQKYIKRLKFARADMSRVTGPFETREEAINFLNTREFFFGDPFVVKYNDREDEGKTKLLLAIGKSGNPSVTTDTEEVTGGVGPDAYELIDAGSLRTELEKLKEDVSANTEAIEELNDAVAALQALIDEMSGSTGNLQEIVGTGFTEDVSITDRIKRDEELTGIKWGHDEGEPMDGRLDPAAAEIPGNSVMEKLISVRDASAMVDTSLNARCDSIQGQLDDEKGYRKAIKLVKINPEKFASLGIGPDVRDAYFVTYHKPQSTEPYEDPQPGDAIIKVYKDSVIYKIYMGHMDDQIVSATDPTIIPGTGETALCFIYFNANGEYTLSASDFDLGDEFNALRDEFDEFKDETATAITSLNEGVAAAKTEVVLDEETRHITLETSTDEDGHVVYEIGENDIASETALNFHVARIDGMIADEKSYRKSIKIRQLTARQVEDLYGANTDVREAYKLIDHNGDVSDSDIVKVYKDAVSLNDMDSFDLTYDPDVQEIQLTWLSGGQNRSTHIDVSDFVKDSFLEGVQVVTRDGVQYLEFRFKTYDGEPIPIYIPFADLATIYKAGDGIDRDEFEDHQVVTVKIDPMHEGENSWLAKDPNGLRVTGITEYVDEQISAVTDSLENYVRKDEVEDHLDSASTLPVQNKVVTEALDDVREDLDNIMGSLSAFTADTIYANEYLNLPTATTTQFGVVILDDHLDENSENPVQNKAITKVILDNEETTAAALNDLNDRKADKSYVDDSIEDAISGIDFSTFVTNNDFSTFTGATLNDVATAGTGNVVTKVEKDGTNVKVTYGNVDVSSKLDAQEFQNYTASTATAFTSENITATALTATTISATTYNNLPTATTTNYGMVILDDELDEESTNPVQNSAITKVILENEETVAAALNDLNNRKADRTELAELEDTIENHEIRITTVEEAIETLASGGITGVTSSNTGNVVTKVEKDGLNVKVTYGNVSADDRVLNTTFTAYTASTQTVLADKADKSYVDVNFFHDAEYYSSGNTHEIRFKDASGNTIATVNADDFIKDGMVDNVQISGSSLVITFNTDAGKQPISIPLASIFDPSNYYNKTEVDNLFAAETARTENTYLKEHQSLANYPTTNEMNAAISAATATTTGWVEDQNYLTQHQDISGKLDKTDFNTFTANTLNEVTFTNSGDFVKTIQQSGDEVSVTFGAFDTDLDTGSTNAVQNKVITQTIIDNELVVSAALNDLNDRKADKTEIPTNISDLEGSENIAMKSDLDGYLPLSGGTMTGNISGSTGNAIYMPGGFFQQSDENLKIFAGEIENALDKAKEIPTKYFYWKSRPDGPRELGTSAQKVKEMFPEIVSGDDNLSVDYSKLAIVALAAVKELTAKVEDLQKQLDELKK